MKNIIVGTAGHIDHGKTTLIKALTGRNTDRWEEEQRRGITIDLGFTYFDLKNGDRVGIIDVPGHEKFINNMVAGVVGMDLVLLVVAADEGIMPQTREHMDILGLLGIKKSILVINKCDLVDEEWLDRLGGTPLDMNEAASRVAAKIGADTEDIRIWQEEDDGRIRYEGEAFHDGVKAEFEMDAETGIIFDWDLGITAENEDR